MRGYYRFFIRRFCAAVTVAGTFSLGLFAVSDTALAKSVQPKAAPPVIAHIVQAQTQSNSSLVTEPAVTAFSICISAVGGIVAYSVNESWKRRQYIESKIKDFEGSLETINVRKMLNAELQCIELFPYVEPAAHRFVIIEDCCWAEALLECKCNHTLKKEYERIEKDNPLYKQDAAVKAVVRDNFNRFMHHLQHFEKMIQAGALCKRKLRSYLYPWLESLKAVNNAMQVNCVADKTTYTPQEALLEYMGLVEGTSEEDLSIVQRDVRALVTRYRSLSSLQEKNPSHPQPTLLPESCSALETV
ncbi:MAG: hypothetical protein F6K19_45850 [Cyanothece sp. SIO1E1]|nr:hypothetical protein [Cyanothece sp. SIO1E1]